MRDDDLSTSKRKVPFAIVTVDCPDVAATRTSATPRPLAFLTVPDSSDNPAWTVGTGVLVGRGVRVGRLVLVGVLVRVAVAVMVAVAVTEGTAVGTAVTVGVIVAVGSMVGEGSGVGVAV